VTRAIVVALVLGLLTASCATEEDVIREEEAARYAQRLAEFTLAIRATILEGQPAAKTDSCEDTQPLGASAPADSGPGSGHVCVKSEILPAVVSRHTYERVNTDDAWVKQAVVGARQDVNEASEYEAGMIEMFSAADWDTTQGFGEVAEIDGQRYYRYLKPIVVADGCIACHGSPAGDPDPFFPEYAKDGWETGDVAGAVSAAVLLLGASAEE